MDIGALRHPVGIERNVMTQDPNTGEMIEGWSEVARDWASIVGVRGDEIVAAQATQALTTHRITMRYRADLKAEDRINDGTTVYNVRAVLPDNARRFTRLMCEVIEA